MFFKRQNLNHFIFARVFNRGRDIICQENGCSLDSGCCEPPLRRTILENNEWKNIYYCCDSSHGATQHSSRERMNKQKFACLKVVLSFFCIFPKWHITNRRMTFHLPSLLFSSHILLQWLNLWMKSMKTFSLSTNLFSMQFLLSIRLCIFLDTYFLTFKKFFLEDG